MSLDALRISHDTAFDVRRFMIAHNLQPVGVSFYREAWSEHVTQIYRNILSERI